MSESKRDKLREPLLSELLQDMAEHRARINPRAIPDICHWLFAFRQRFEKMANQGRRGANKQERARRRGQKAFAKQMLGLLDLIEHNLWESVDLRDIDRSRAEWAKVVTFQREV